MIIYQRSTPLSPVSPRSTEERCWHGFGQRVAREHRRSGREWATNDELFALFEEWARKSSPSARTTIIFMSWVGYNSERAQIDEETHGEPRPLAIVV